MIATSSESYVHPRSPKAHLGTGESNYLSRAENNQRSQDQSPETPLSPWIRAGFAQLLRTPFYMHYTSMNQAYDLSGLGDI